MSKTRKYSKKGGRPTTKAKLVQQFLLSGNYALRKKYKTCKHYKDKYTNLIKKCNKEIEKINIKINKNVKAEEKCKPYPTIRIYDSSTPIENIYEKPVFYKTPESNRSISINSLPHSLSLSKKTSVPPALPERMLKLKETTLQRKKPSPYFMPTFNSDISGLRGNTKFKKSFYNQV